MKYAKLLETITRKDIHNGCLYVLKKDLSNLSDEEYKRIIKYINKYNINIEEYLSSKNSMMRDVVFLDNINLLEYESWLKDNNISFNQLLSEKDTIYLINQLRMSNDIILREKVIKGNIYLIEYLLSKFSSIFNIDCDEYRTYAYEVLLEIIDNYDYSKDLYEYINKKVFLELFNVYCCNEGISLDIFSSLRNFIEIKYNSDYSEFNSNMYNDVINILFNEGLIYYDTKNILLEKYYLDRNFDNEISAGNDVKDNFDYVNLMYLLDRIINTLKIREENLIRYYYGIGTKKHNMSELTSKYGVSRAFINLIIKSAKNEIKYQLLKYYDKDIIKKVMYMSSIDINNTEEDIFNYEIDDEFIDKLFLECANNKYDRKKLRIADLNRKKLLSSATKGNSKAMYLCMYVFKWIKRDYALKYYDENTKIGDISLFRDDIERNFYKLLKGSLIRIDSDELNRAVKTGNDKALYIYLRKSKGYINCLKIEEIIDDYPYDYKVDGIYGLYDNIDLGSFYSASRLYVYHKLKYNEFIENKNYWGDLGERILDLVQNNIIQKYTLDEYSMYTALRFNKISKELALKTYNIDHEFLGIKLFENTEYAENVLDMIDKVYEDDINFFDNYSKEAKYLKRYIQVVIAEAEHGNDKAYHLLEQVHEIIDDKKYVNVVRNYMDSKTKILKK